MGSTITMLSTRDSAASAILIPTGQHEKYYYIGIQKPDDSNLKKVVYTGCDSDKLANLRRTGMVVFCPGKQEPMDCI